MSDSVTNDDLRMAVYFLREKGDINCWVSWPSRKAIIGREYPELLLALEQLSVAQEKLNDILKEIEENID